MTPRGPLHDQGGRVLDSHHRLTGSGAFAGALRGSTKGVGRHVIVHARANGTGDVAKVGLVVAKSVGNAVVRNRVKRRLRAAVRSHLGDLPPGSTLVLRSLPSAGTAPYQALEADLDRALHRALSRLVVPAPRLDRVGV